MNGWGVGEPPPGVNVDEHDRLALQGLITQNVVPAYGDRSVWTAMMTASIVDSSERFSADRCVQRYYDELYVVHEKRVAK